MTRFVSSLMLLFAAGVLVCSGCGGKDGGKDGPKKDAKPSAGNKAKSGGSKGVASGAQSDPMEVLKAFLAAIRAKDKDKCLSLVHPDNREELKRDMDRGFPPIPDSPQLAVTPSADGNSAGFTGVPALKNLKLKKHEGKWWIAD